MILKQGNMFVYLKRAKHKVFVTTNATVKHNGALVMGKGAALMAKQCLKNIDFTAGCYVRLHSEKVPTKEGKIHIRYGIIETEMLGLFQVKYNWWDSADLDLIKFSTDKLVEFAKMKSDITIHLNFPGIKNGNLKREDVLPIIQILPDNVFVWEYDNEE